MEDLSQLFKELDSEVFEKHGLGSSSLSPERKEEFKNKILYHLSLLSQPVHINTPFEMNNKTAISHSVAEALIKKKKFVFLFGAGASIPSGIPGSNELKLLLYQQKIRPIVTAFKELAKNIAIDFSDLREGRLRDITFEQLMTLACTHHKSEIIAKWLEQYIPDIYASKIRYLPSIAYEFICHLMNNGLVKFVVNFNYDEILDKAIEDELGKNKCSRIVTDEDFERLSIMLEYGESLVSMSHSFLFKPHGTRSMRRSFKYRIEDVDRFEFNKDRVLKHVIKDSIIILMGYSAEELDFRNLIVDIGFNGIEKMYVIRRTPQITINYFGDNKKIIGYEGTSEEFFEGLANSLFGESSSFKSDYEKYYTKATRHFIRSKINKQISPITVSSDEKQRKAEIRAKVKAQEVALNDNILFFEELNIVIEILIYCFKVRGLFTREALMSCNRVTSALDMYLRKAKEVKGHAQNPIEKILKELKNRNILNYDDDYKSLLDEKWCYMPLDKSTNDKDDRNLFEEMAEKAFRKYLMNYLKGFVDVNDASLGTYLIRAFSSLPEDFDYDLLTDDMSLYPFPLKSINRINTREDFREKTEATLDMVAKDVSLSVLSPSVAEWLYKWGRNSVKSHKIQILINENVYAFKNSIHYKHIEPIVEFIKKLGDTRQVPNVRHALTLAYKNEHNKITGKAILFSREGKTSTISPVYIEETAMKSSDSDIEKLKIYFDNMFERGKALI